MLVVGVPLFASLWMIDLYEVLGGRCVRHILIALADAESSFFLRWGHHKNKQAQA